MADQDVLGKRLDHSVGLLERVVQFRWALLLLSLLIAADTSVAVFYGRSIAMLEWGQASTPQFSLSTGTYFLFLAAYVLYMASVSRVLQYFIEQSWWALRSSAIGNFFEWTRHDTESYRAKYARGYVRLSEARVRSLRDKDAFWIARVSAAEQNRERIKSEQESLAHLSFACGFLLFLNYFTGAGVLASVEAKIVALAEPMKLAAVLALLFSTLSIIAPWWLSMYQDLSHLDWIEHPELARALLQEDPYSSPAMVRR